MNQRFLRTSRFLRAERGAEGTKKMPDAPSGDLKINIKREKYKREKIIKETKNTKPKAPPALVARPGPVLTDRARKGDVDRQDRLFISQRETQLRWAPPVK